VCRHGIGQLIGHTCSVVEVVSVQPVDLTRHRIHVCAVIGQSSALQIQEDAVDVAPPSTTCKCIIGNMWRTTICFVGVRLKGMGSFPVRKAKTLRAALCHTQC